MLCLNRAARNLRNKQPTKTLPAGAYEEHCLISYKSTNSILNTLSCLVLNWASSRWVCGCVLHGLSCWLARLLGYKHNQTFHKRKISQTLSERKVCSRNHMLLPSTSTFKKYTIMYIKLWLHWPWFEIQKSN